MIEISQEKKKLVSDYFPKVMFVALWYTIWNTGYESEQNSHRQNTRNGMFCCLLFILGYGFMRNKRQPFQPEWVFRTTSVLSVLFVCWHIMLFCHNPIDARALNGYLQLPPSEDRLADQYQTWQKDCSISMDNLYKKMDSYTLGHFIGWVLMSFIFRDYYYMQVWSVLTELLEFTFRDAMPVFGECWWDQLIGDVIVTNIPGMIVGMTILRYFKLQEYDWFGRKGKKNILHWDFFKYPNTFWSCWIAQLGMTAQFLCFFFGANALRLIPTSSLVGFKLLFWWNIGNSAFNELTRWGQLKPGEPDYTEGEYRWVGCCMMVIDIMVCYKNYAESALLADEPKILPWIFYSWMAFLFTQICVYLKITLITRPKYMSHKQIDITNKVKAK